ncbi:DUF2956 domain-containing protein [Parasalinivibrio latis]|uniref:DUF2956 domain-containing protein n=1 Tax=Parasalinivibrio latis TaxID=2952610 RepID=UPI0030E0F2B0
MNKDTISPETQQEAMKIAKATQKPGQTKEQTKLIAQGIEKGIALYKKQQKVKAREKDKLRKKQIRDKRASGEETADTIEHEVTLQNNSSILPWVLLAISWAVFVAVFILFK